MTFVAGSSVTFVSTAGFSAVTFNSATGGFAMTFVAGSFMTFVSTAGVSAVTFNSAAGVSAVTFIAVFAMTFISTAIVKSPPGTDINMRHPRSSGIYWQRTIVVSAAVTTTIVSAAVSALVVSGSVTGDLCIVQA
jgi:hypothetical protein